METLENFVYLRVWSRSTNEVFLKLKVVTVDGNHFQLSNMMINRRL